jgi:DNA-binding NarL/FixJ family response regulator
MIGPMKPITILLADDHAVVRKGIQLIAQGEPDLEVVGVAKDGREAVELFQKLKPDVTILDHSMPGLNGLEAAAQIAKLDGRASMIMLSMHSDATYIMRAISAGVSAYVSKESAEDEIVDAIRAVAAGKPYLSSAIAHRLLVSGGENNASLEDPYDMLTSREKETLQLVAEGKTNKEIAAILNLSPHTVETHRNNLMQKLDLHSLVALVMYAVRRRLVM